MTTAQATFKIGDLVVVRAEYVRASNQGKVYRVTKILKVNIVVEPVDGGRGLRGNPEVFEHAPEGTTAELVDLPYLPPFAPGEVVTIAGPGWKQPADRFYVVLHEGNDGKVKVAQLGGDNGRYWPKIPRSMITVVDPTLITVKYC